jgi:hypothetical protein
MSFAKKMMFTMLLLVAGSFGAAAQDTAIRFKLAQEAHIGSVTLAPGMYRMAFFGQGHPYAIVTAEEGHRTSIIALAATSESGCSSSSVTLTPADEGFSLTSACFAQADTALYFPVASARKSVATQPVADSAWAGAK